MWLNHSQNIVKKIKRKELENLVIRSAEVRAKDVGYLICADPEREENDEPHALTFTLRDGQLSPGDRNYNAHSQCIVSDPEIALVDVSAQGYFGITSKDGFLVGDLLADDKRTGVRSVKSIGGKAYVVGLRGMAYRLDSLKEWTRIDESLPATADLKAADGLDASDIYAVGNAGAIWLWNGKAWEQLDSPTNQNLLAVAVDPDERAYLAGDNGVMLQGSKDGWEIVETDLLENANIWDLQWFKGKLYVSTFEGLYVLENGALDEVDFGDQTPNSFYHLSACEEVLWQIGEFGILSFDGENWSRVI